MATCSDKNEALQWDPRLLLLFAILLLRLRIISGIRPWLRYFGVIWHERCVENRFILLRDAAPPSAVLQNFLSLEFYRPPVTLEDTKVLGYMCDSTSRTITPQLPDHPSQIKAPMIRCLLTPRGHLDRGSLCVELNQQSNNKLALMLSNVFMKPKASTLTS